MPYPAILHALFPIGGVLHGLHIVGLFLQILDFVSHSGEPVLEFWQGCVEIGTGTERGIQYCTTHSDTERRISKFQMFGS